MICEKCGKETLNEQELCEECLKKENNEIINEVSGKPNKKLNKLAFLFGLLSIAFTLISFTIWGLIISFRFLSLIPEVTRILASIISLFATIKSLFDFVAGGLMIAGLVVGIISAAKKRGKRGMIFAIIAVVLFVLSSVLQTAGNFIVSFIINSIM